MKRVTVDELPEEPLAAAGVFHQHWLPHVETLLTSGEDVMVALAPADHTHREWRRAIAAGLARAHTPRRANVVAGESAVHDAFAAYLEVAPGVTGQYLEGDAQGAGDPAEVME
ncbi:MAG: hypothetical protein EOP59_18575 [Sphingomonadales bacterium]|nr:MAG: hypothetical protein EOP59_18575 [Sphingomonadales bacterium]